MSRKWNKQILIEFPGKLQLQKNNSEATQNLTLTIKYEIWNYKETSQSVFVDDEALCSASAGTCDCEDSSFRDEDHGHITGIKTDNKY